MRASGYIFGAFHAEPRDAPEPRNETTTNEYGYRIHPALHTSMHDHVVNFKADLDICSGTRNTLVRTSIEPLRQTYDWDQPEVSGQRNTMHMVHRPVTHETGLDWPSNSRDMYLVTAPGSLNKWGETRAYRIQPGTGMGTPAHLTIVNSTTLGRSALWSTSDLWVLRNHPETEPGAAHHLNYLAPLDPLVDFEAMVDGEAIEEEDLVVYFNLGSHHVPSSQDVPNTLMHTSASSVMFVPFNYFDGDVSRAVGQGVRIDRRAGAGARATAGRRDKGRKKEAVYVADKNKETVNAADKGKADKEEIKRPRVAPRAAAIQDDEGVKYFGGRYTGPVTVPEKMLSPDLSHYMKEKVPADGEGSDGGWRAIRNNVGGGLLGLFVGKDRAVDDNGGERRMDW